MIRQPIRFSTRIALAVLAIVVIVIGYGLLSARQHRINSNDTTIPNGKQFVEGWKKVIDWNDIAAAQHWNQKRDVIRKSWLVEDAWASFVRLFLGITAGVALAFFVGMAMGCFTHVEALLLPPVAFLAKIPPTAMLAVYFVLFGTNLKLFVAMIALGISPTLAQAIYQAARKDVTDHAIYKAFTLGASPMEVIWNVVFKQILPRVIENVRLQVGPAMVFLIAAEWMLADVGFGYRLRIQSRLLNMNVVYIYLAILGCVGFIFDWLLSALRRRVAPWFGV